MNLLAPRLDAPGWAAPSGHRPRPVALGLIAGAHLLAFWALGQPAVREHVVAAAPPLMVRIVGADRPSAEPEPELRAPSREPSRPPMPAPLPVPVVDQRIAAEPTAPAPAPPSPAPLEPPATAAPVATAPPPPPAPAAAPERQIAITQVEYLTPPVLAYPLASRRQREEGRVEVRVRVDEQGRPSQTALLRGSGFDRLDEAALATVRATRFKPYTENGVPRAFWVVMPLIFEL